MNKSEESDSTSDSGSDSESLLSIKVPRAKELHKKSSEDTDSEDSTDNKSDKDSNEESEKTKIESIYVKPKRKQRLNNFSKHSSKCHPLSQTKLFEGSKGMKKSGKCFYCERNKHTFSPFAKRPFKILPQICEGCADTQIYEYFDDELEVNCYAYFSPHCNQCIRLRKKRFGKICCKEITMNDINMKRNHLVFDKILLNRLKEHTREYLSKYGSENKTENNHLLTEQYKQTCFYCEQGSKRYDSILYEKEKLLFCSERYGSIYSYTERIMKGGRNQDRNKYYTYYSKECRKCMYEKDYRDIDHKYGNDSLLQDEITIKENEKRITKMQQKQERKQKELREYEHVTHYLSSHRYKYKQFPKHNYGCKGNPMNRAKIESHNWMMKQHNDRVYCSNDFPVGVMTDYPLDAGYEIVIPSSCYYCNRLSTGDACDGCLASLYIYTEKYYCSEEEDEISHRKYVLYSSSCKKCLDIMQKKQGIDNRMVSDEKLSFEDVLNQDNALRTERKEHEKKVSDKLKNKQLKVWRTRVYGLLKIHREATVQTHTKQCIERKCYGCASFGIVGHDAWCKGKSSGCYYCEQPPGRYLDTQYTDHSSNTRWPTFCDACPASIYDFTKTEFCSYFNNQTTLSYFKYYTKGCTRCEMFKTKRCGVEVTEDILSID